MRWGGRQTGTGTEVTSTLILICMEERRVGDEGERKEYRVGERSGQNVSAWQNKSVCLYPAVVCDRGGRQARWWFWQTDRLLMKLPACHWGLALVGMGDGEEWTKPSSTETSDLKQSMKTRCNMGKLNQRSTIVNSKGIYRNGVKLYLRQQQHCSCLENHYRPSSFLFPHGFSSLYPLFVHWSVWLWCWACLKKCQIFKCYFTVCVCVCVHSSIGLWL